MKSMNYINLLERFLKGETSPEEEQSLFKWFRQPDTKQEMMSGYDELLENVSPQVDPELQNRMWNSITQKILPETNIIQLQVRHFKQIAAVACIIILITTGIYYFLQKPMEQSQDFIVTVERGQKAELELSDGAKVWLNSDSKLLYDNKYNTKDRKVQLYGEAFFEVEPFKEKPFIVSTEYMDIEALGTSFNVKSYQTDSFTSTTLLEGKVKVTSVGFNEILFPGDNITYNHATGKITKTTLYDPAISSAWRDGNLSFTGESLSEIATMLERLYNIVIMFETEETKKYSFAGIINNNSLSNVLEVISISAPIRYSIENSTVTIYKK